MSEYAISADMRTVSGKKVKDIRLAGMTPGVIYGGGEDAIMIQMSSAKLAAVFRAGGKSEEIAVTVEGTTYNVTVQELQRHITRGDLMHVDFLKAN